MAHAGVKNAYRATIHTWSWAWHLKPHVVHHLSAALSTSVTTNSLKLIMNDPFWEFVHLLSAEYWVYVHWKRRLMPRFRSMLFRTVISMNEASRKELRCIVDGKLFFFILFFLCDDRNEGKDFCGVNDRARRKTSVILRSAGYSTKHFAV